MKTLLVICFLIGLLTIHAQDPENNENGQLPAEFELEFQQFSEFKPPNIENACWLYSYGRGVGTPITTCAPGLQQDALLCYPYCEANYTGIGPVCWQDCPPNFPDQGAFCAKPAAYGRGAGYPLWDESECVSQNPQGCQKNGLLWYPDCAQGFYAFGCCVCSPQCQDGMTDIGVSCAKNSYGRGAGVPLGCASDQVEDAALCYPACSGGLNGVGPVCWSSCPSGWSQCGALCLQNSTDCTGEVEEMSLDVLKAAVALANTEDDPMGAVIAILKVATDFAWGICN
jgi:hypothetical protein